MLNILSWKTRFLDFAAKNFGILFVHFLNLEIYSEDFLPFPEDFGSLSSSCGSRVLVLWSMSEITSNCFQSGGKTLPASQSSRVHHSESKMLPQAWLVCLKKISLHLTVVKFIPACTHVSLNEDLALRKFSIWVEYIFIVCFLCQDYYLSFGEESNCKL